MQIFSQEKPIYLQIYDRICTEILSGRLQEHSRIPGVRDYGALLQVNANTAVKAYEQLSRDNIIFQKRGMGYFVAEGARQLITEQRRETLMHDTLTKLFHDMRLLDVSIDDIVTEYLKFQEQSSRR